MDAYIIKFQKRLLNICIHMNWKNIRMSKYEKRWHSHDIYTIISIQIEFI